MTATKTPGIWKLATAGPAVTADNSRLSGHHQALARYTTDRQKQIGRSADCRRQPETADGQVLPAASSKAFFIADWSGSSPNQHSKAATPW